MSFWNSKIWEKLFYIAKKENKRVEKSLRPIFHLANLLSILNFWYSNNLFILYITKKELFNTEKCLEKKCTWTKPNF